MSSTLEWFSLLVAVATVRTPTAHFDALAITRDAVEPTGGLVHCFPAEAGDEF
jgi:hypothetical protein